MHVILSFIRSTHCDHSLIHVSGQCSFSEATATPGVWMFPCATQVKLRASPFVQPSSHVLLMQLNLCKKKLLFVGAPPCADATRMKRVLIARAHTGRHLACTRSLHVSANLSSSTPQGGPSQSWNARRRKATHQAEYDKVFRAILLCSRHWAPVTRPRLC